MKLKSRAKVTSFARDGPLTKSIIMRRDEILIVKGKRSQVQVLRKFLESVAKKLKF